LLKEYKLPRVPAIRIPGIRTGTKESNETRGINKQG
jgi:hypothetical protein